MTGTGYVNITFTHGVDRHRACIFNPYVEASVVDGFNIKYFH